MSTHGKARTDNCYDVLCLGLANINAMIRPVDENVFSRDLTLIDPVELVLGGDAMNEAVVFSKLGARAAILSCVGDDELGELLLRTAAKEGVDTAYVCRKAGERTAFCAVFIREDGVRHFASCRGALNGYALPDIDFGVIRRARLVCIGSLFALRALDGYGIERVLREAKSAGAITAADMMMDIYGLGISAIENILPLLDYVMPSLEEAERITGESVPERMADVLITAGAKRVVLKMGSDGVLIRGDGESLRVPAFPVRAVDTTGAGDCFVAAFLTGVLKGWGIERCARFGCAAGALNVQEVGPTAGVSNMERVLALVRNRHDD